MALYNDLIHASELTVFARRSQRDIESQGLSLGSFFPQSLVDSDVAKYTVTEGGLVPVAEYRAYDAESSIGGQGGGRNVAMQLPPVSQKNRIGELDQIRDRAGNDQAELKVGSVTVDTTSAVLGRIEALRGTVLETGRVTIEENGFYADEDLGRNSDMTVTVENGWETEDGAGLDDLIAIVEKYSDVNNVLPGTILGSNKIISALQRNKQFRSAIGGVNVPAIASMDQVNAVLGTYELPTITRYSRSVNIGGTTKKVLSPDKLFLLPAAGTIELGQTVFGRTAEADSPEYGIAAAEAPGLVAGVNREWDPYAYWVRVNGIALPVMTNPNASLVAQVINVAG